MTEVARPTHKPRYEMSSVVLGVAGFFLGCASVLIFGRWGLSPILPGMAGLVAMPLASNALSYKTSRVPGGWRGQVVMMVIIVLIFAGVARWSACISPQQAFDSAFGVPIPATVTHVEVERQYFDGYVISLAFKANAQDMKKILSAKPFVSGDGIFDSYRNGELSWEECWRLYTSPWVKIVNPGWPDPPATVATNFYQYDPGANGIADSVKVFWDSGSGQAYVLCFTD